MTKNQKMLLGAGAVAVVAYLLWKKQQTSFTGASNRFATVGSRQKNAVGTGKLATTTNCLNKAPAPQCDTRCSPRFTYTNGWKCGCTDFSTAFPKDYSCDTWMPL